MFFELVNTKDLLLIEYPKAMFILSDEPSISEDSAYTYTKILDARDLVNPFYTKHQTVNLIY